MTHHADNLRIDQLLRNGGANLGVGLVVFGQHDEFGIFAVNLDIGGIGLFDREAGAIFIVLAQMGNATGERCHVPDPDFNRGRRRGWRGLGFLATSRQQ